MMLYVSSAGPYSYYGGGSETGIGPAACNMSDGSMHFPDWPDMHRPLGVPKGDFKNSTVGGNAAVLTREFATGTRVVMNAIGSGREASANFACVYWSDHHGFTTGLPDPEDAGAQPCPTKAELDALFTSAGW
jgi:hypothetical protein